MLLNHFQALKLHLHFGHSDLRDFSMTVEAKRPSMIKFFRYQIAIIGLGDRGTLLVISLDQLVLFSFPLGTNYLHQSSFFLVESLIVNEYRCLYMDVTSVHT